MSGGGGARALLRDACRPLVGSVPVVVAIPAKDEADRIGTCIAALAGQVRAPRPLLLLLANNCGDQTADVARTACAAGDLDCAIVEAMLPPDRASAGLARSVAMRLAAERVAADGVLLTTDADGRPEPDWLASNLRAIADGADAVAGRAIIDPVEALLIPQELHEADAREVAYGALLDEITAIIDPDPTDPWPRHTEHNGASIAVTKAAYLRAGGMPGIPLGEDRAFFEALRRSDARIRHAPDVTVVVSGRIEGRAKGGMADTIRRRLTAPDLLVDERFEPVDDAIRRASLRRLMRLVHDGREAPAPLALGLELPANEVIAQLGRGFGAAWAVFEDRSPVLRRRRLPVAELGAQTMRAQFLRSILLSEGSDGLGGIAADAPGGPVAIGTRSRG